MQRLKDLTLTVSEKKATLKFFSNEEICQLSSMNMCENKKYWYIHDIIDTISNRTEFQLNQIRTKKFQLTLSNIAVTLQYNQGH